MKYLFSYYLLLITLYSFADMPGNKPRPDYNVKITGLKEYKEYTFYSQGYDSAVILRDSSSIYIQGQNLLTFTKYNGLDPEINGFDRRFVFPINPFGSVKTSAMPVLRTIAVGLNISI